VSPLRTAIISWRAKVPFYVLCAFLTQESSGGHNLYGHDAGMPFEGAGPVTQTNYAQYKTERDSTDPPRCQGVGPMQLTWKPYQDRADAAGLRGGCWRAYTNTLTGARILAEIRADVNSWVEVARNWSGKDSYAEEMRVELARWRGVMAAA